MKKFFIVFTLFLIYCSSSTGPKNINPRSFSWSADTVYQEGAFQASMRSFWGSADDLCVSGHSSRTEVMYHYNGKEWQGVDLSQGALRFPKDLNGDLFGFSSSNIWATGEEYSDDWITLILHYDGTQWAKQTLDVPMVGYMSAIWGDSEENLWAGGSAWAAGSGGILYKYDNGIWLLQELDIKDKDKYNFIIHKITGNEYGDAYLALKRFDLGYSWAGEFYYHLQDGKWNLMDSLYSDESDIWVSPSGILYTCGNKVRSYNGESWEYLNDMEALSYSHVVQITGTSDDNIFISAILGDISANVLHYNGTNWHNYKELSSVDNSFYWALWTDGNEVFATGTVSDNGQSKALIWHGK